MQTFWNRVEVKTGLTIAVVATVIALSTNANFYNSSMIDAFMALALASALITLTVVRFSWIDLTFVVAGTVLLAALDFRVLHFQPRFMAWLSFIGLTSLCALGLRCIWSCGPEQTLFLYAFLPAAIFAFSEYSASTLLDYTEYLHPKTFDLYLYSFDCSLRLQPSFLMGQVYSLSPWFRFAGLLFYIALPLPLALVYAAHLRQKSESGQCAMALPIMLAFLVTGPIGVLYYNLVPAMGPVHLFGANFPWFPMSTEQARHMILQTVPIKGARNAIPSLHMTWVLLIWWNSRGLALWIRSIAFAFVAFTVCATLGIGEHYFIDLVVAFPFALMIQALCRYDLSFRGRVRQSAFVFGIFTSLVWMALVSFQVGIMWLSPVIPWTLIAITIVATCFLIERLQAQETASSAISSPAVAKARPAGAGN